MVLTLPLLGACGPEAAEGASLVEVETRDGVMLVADWYDAGAAGPGFLLLHMNPLSYDRTVWPADFVSALNGKGWSVLVPDRRGAGDSAGQAEDAFTGDGGKYDVEACALFLEEEERTPLVVVGASNGTTSLLDYAIWAPEEGLPEMIAAGFMTGGTYTENNHAMTDFPAGIPSVFTYSTEERDWSVGQQTLDPGSWEFFEYPDGDHGTKMFDAAPEVAEDLVGFFGGEL